MKRVDRNEQNLLQYGISTTLANKASRNSLSVTKLRSLSIADLTEKFDLEENEAKELKKCVVRQAIEPDTVDILLRRSNFLCNICKGKKSAGYIIHHIDPYEETQNNRYDNLIVLCPSDHDLAHRSGLTLGINKEQLKIAKKQWENLVQTENVKRASRSVDIEDNAIDYVNVARIEEACISVFGAIPDTFLSNRLRQKGILDHDLFFDYQFVKNHLSNGAYLFDYPYAGETHHYRELLQKLCDEVEFVDIEDFMSVKKIKSGGLEGKYAYFTAGMHVSSPEVPIVETATAIPMRYRRRAIRIEWLLDPKYFMSMSAITRMRGTVRYTVYCHVRSIVKDSEGWLIKASPFLIAPPKIWIDRTPAIGYQKKYSLYMAEQEEIEDGFDIDDCNSSQATIQFFSNF